MINKETIISVYDEKLTLLQWLKSVNKALDEAVLTNVEIEQRGNATFVFVFTFKDGTRVESNEIIVNQGESIVGATIQNGHLLLTLSNDDVLDAGNVKPVSSFSFNASRHLIVTYGDGTSQDLGLIKGVSGFSINESQHLIVTYDNGTTEDLGAIFSGNVNINGNFTANSIIENMSNYTFSSSVASDVTKTTIYAGAVKNGNKLTLVWFGSIKNDGEANRRIEICKFTLPVSIASKIYPYSVSPFDNVVCQLNVVAWSSYISNKTMATFGRRTDAEISFDSYLTELNVGSTYLVRIEVTFLLSDSLAS